MNSLTDNLTQVIESRLNDFAKRFAEENSSTVESAVNKARPRKYTCKRIRNKKQRDHTMQVLKAKSYEKIKVALNSGTKLVSKLKQSN